MEWPFTLVFPLIAFFSSMLGTRYLITYLSIHSIVDRPNKRSSHIKPTPRGGGLAVICSVFSVWLVIGFSEGLEGVGIITITGISLILAGVSLIDDLRGRDQHWPKQD